MYTRLCYVSQATKPDHLMRKDLMDIIDEAVEFNEQHHIFGVLYYGHGYFFQCLEGDQDQVEHLFYHRIRLDRRHKNTKLLQCIRISQIYFDSWNMKYAPQAKALMDFFKDSEKPIFNPYLINDEQLPKFLEALYLD